MKVSVRLVESEYITSIALLCNSDVNKKLSS